MATQQYIVSKSPIGFDSSKVQQITDILNPDLATLFQLFELWQKHQWYVRGSEYKELHKCFDAWGAHSLQHADTVAERIVTVGGVPLDPTDFPQASGFQFKQAGVPGIREMLQHQLEALLALLQKLRNDITQLD
ncbi:DNA starvation/stationary phase protection protein [Brevibacillus sp. RS1.1]|uniref:DNA starvation/stationary phase protection protein n=1 Tax=Brevibacillus sp. RS1.1 TaxID=2738982 RepID=UPI00156BA56A|nr:DNA starvation/stationary phase protection protein [Brevibacillus sp. RS1.1]NRR02655.1 DNA starvation/stationary phase protection protein [Brevibacillus sp. RS1.1]